MSFGKTSFLGTRGLFTALEKRNIFFYVFGIMLYKFGVEAFNGSIISLATNRYDQDAHRTETSTRTFERVGLLIGLNQASQCFGSALIGPLIKRWRTQVVLSATIFVFALSSAIFMVIDAATGGSIRPRNFVPRDKNDFSFYGKYPTDIIIPIYCISGLTFGMVESIRRVIPANIAGDNLVKLRKMDALVHIFYEVAGVSGAFVTALVLIPNLGNNHAFMITPILFAFAGVVWLFIRSAPTKRSDHENEPIPDLKRGIGNYFKTILHTGLVFFRSMCVGAKIVFTSRQFIWLFAAYPLGMYAHRYIENSVAPQVARRYLHQSAWSQILVGGSNFGELLGALLVFFLNDRIKSPLPFVRIDALMLLILWYIPYYYPVANQMSSAWIMAAILVPIGCSSAVRDISLDAHIQSSMARLESKHRNVSPLGAVVAFLYSTYIMIYSIANPFLGRHIDYVFNTTGNVRPAFVYTICVQLTVVFFIMFMTTFIPRGAFTWNPALIDDDPSPSEKSEPEEYDMSIEHKKENHEHEKPVHQT